MAIAAQILIDTITRLKTTVEPAEMNMLITRANDSESSMKPERLQAAKTLFEDTIKPHYKAQFNQLGGIDAIFAKIKEMILEEIIAEPNKSWLRNNKASLTNTNHQQYQAVLAESRQYLNSCTNPSHIAWRNFDETNPQLLMYRYNWFVGDRRDDVIRERLAYYYLAITDEKAVPDLAERQFLKVNFIGKLADCRRKNGDVFGMDPNDFSEAPACDRGTLGRIADMGQGHPIAQLWFTVEEALPPFIQAKAVEKLKQLFLKCKTNQERKDIIDNLQKALGAFSATDLNKRNQILLDAWGIKYVNGAYQLSGDWAWEVEGKLPAGFQLWHIHHQKILLMLLDPMSYFGPAILKMYHSCEPLREARVETNAIGLNFIDHYRACLDAEQKHANKVRLEWSPDAFSNHFCETAVKKRIIDELSWAGHHGGLPAEVEKGIARIENTDLLQKYTRKFLELKESAGEAFDYQACREQAIIALLSEKQLDFISLSTEERTPRICALDEHLKQVQQAQTNQRPRAYQQLTPELPLNIATSAYQALEMESGERTRDDLHRYTLNVKKTGPAGDRGPYGDSMALPRLPVVHPYNPTAEASQVRHGGGVPAFIMTVAFSSEARNHLPRGVRASLVQAGVSVENLEVFLCVQDMPWKNVPLLLRPQPWLHPDAPVVGNYNNSSTISVGISGISDCMKVAKNQGVSTHGEGGEVVYSPNNLSIHGVQNPEKSHAFYSLCIDPVKKKAALTLHWLLNDTDALTVSNDFFASLEEDLGYWKKHKPFENSDLVPALEALLGGTQPTLRPGAPQYYLQEQASLAPQSLVDIPPSALECIENSIKSLPVATKDFSESAKIGYLSLLETQYADKFLALPAAEKKLKAKAIEQLMPLPIQALASSSSSSSPIVFSVAAMSLAAGPVLNGEELVLTELVREGNQLTPSFYVFDEAAGSISIATSAPDEDDYDYGIFNLSNETGGQAKNVYYHPDAANILYGNYGFIRRLSAEERAEMPVGSVTSWERAYQDAPRVLQASTRRLSAGID